MGNFARMKLLRILVLCLMGMLVFPLRGLAVPARAMAAPKTESFPKAWEVLLPSDLLEKGKRYAEAQKPDSALLAFSVAAAKWDASLPEEQRSAAIRAKIEAGNLYWYPFYDYPRSYGLFLEVLDQAREQGDQHTVAIAYNNLANIRSIYSATTDMSVAEQMKLVQMYRESLRAAIKARFWPQVLISITNLMSCVNENVPVSTIAQDISEFLKLPIPKDTKDYASTRRRAEGYMAVRDGDYSLARSRFSQINADPTDTDSYNRARINSLFDLTFLDDSQGRKQEALSHLRSIREIVTDNGYMEMLPSVNAAIADYLLAMGDTAGWKEAMFSFYQAKDSMLTQSSIIGINDAVLTNSVGKVEAQLEAKTAESRMHTMLALFIGGLLLISVGFIVWIFRKNRQLRERNRDLYQQVNRANAREAELRARQIEELKSEKAKVKSEKEGAKSEKESVENPALLARILEVMESSAEVYNPEFSLDRLAALCDEKSRTVSAIINASLDKNFPALLGEYRVRRMCELLSETEAGASLTIEAVAQQVGFKSRTTYTAAFRRQTGLTPSEYLRAARTRK